MTDDRVHAFRASRAFPAQAHLVAAVAGSRPAVLEHIAAAGEEGELMLAVKGGWSGYRIG